MRAVYKFCKHGEVRYISHLDLQRTMQRALKRAGTPVLFSKGFHPLPEMSFAQALGVGFESEAEYMELKLEEGSDIADTAEKLNSVLPEGLHITEFNRLDEKADALMAVARAARWRMKAPPDAEEAIKKLMGAQSFELVRVSKGKSKSTDIRPGIISVSAEDDTITALLLAGSVFNVRPGELAEALGMEAQCVTRLELYAQDDVGRYIDMISYARDGLF